MVWMHFGVCSMAQPQSSKAGLAAGKQTRGGADLVGGDPSDRLGPFRRELLHMRGEFGEAVRPLRDEGLVVEFLADDDIEHRQRERIVGAGPDLQPEVRLFGERRAARIDHDGARIVRERLHHIEARLAVRPRQHRVVTPKEDASRRHVAGVIADREIAEGQNRGVDPRMEALGEARLAPIGRAERMAETRHPADMMAAGAGPERDGLGSVLFANCQQALGDLVERVVPGDALPLAGLTFALAPQRIFQPVRVVDEVGRHRPDRAQTAMIERRCAIALDLQQHAIPHMQQYAATAVATAADAFEHGDSRLPTVL